MISPGNGPNIKNMRASIRITRDKPTDTIKVAITIAPAITTVIMKPMIAAITIPIITPRTRPAIAPIIMPARTLKIRAMPKPAAKPITIPITDSKANTKKPEIKERTILTARYIIIKTKNKPVTPGIRRRRRIPTMVINNITKISKTSIVKAKKITNKIIKESIKRDIATAIPTTEPITAPINPKIIAKIAPITAPITMPISKPIIPTTTTPIIKPSIPKIIAPISIKKPVNKAPAMATTITNAMPKANIPMNTTGMPKNIITRENRIGTNPNKDKHE